MPSSPVDTLQTQFGYDSFRPGQEQVITQLLQGHSSLAIFPTGGGKSLCYQLPALLLEGITLVISPLIALMKDQVDSLETTALNAARLDSSLSLEEQQKTYQDLEQQNIKILYLSPELFSSHSFQQRFPRLKIALIAIDEVHCVSEWGHNFRPDYLKLAQLLNQKSAPLLLGLTATATPSVINDIRHHFSIQPQHLCQLSFYRPNLQLHAIPMPQEAKVEWLIQHLSQQDHSLSPTIIYTTRQASAEELAYRLQTAGFSACAYHAGLPTALRDQIQKDFMDEKTLIICATIAFGMGIDKQNIHQVIHYNLPKSLENFMQEIGRAGRAGQPAKCYLLSDSSDLLTLQNFIYASTPSPTSVQTLIYSIFDQPSHWTTSLYQTSMAYDLKLPTLSTLLTYLESDGYIQLTHSFYSSYQFQLARNLEHLLNGFSPRQQDFLTRLFQTAHDTKGAWSVIKPEDSAEALQEPITKITDTLHYLEHHGDLLLKSSQRKHQYTILKRPPSISALVQRTNDLFQIKERNELKRLQNVLSFAHSSSCLYQQLLRYFEEEISPCGRCSSCISEGSSREPSSHSEPLPPVEISLELLESIQSLAQERHPQLRSPQQLARFLCGISSPATQYGWFLPQGSKRKKRLLHHESYALLEHIPFLEVLTLCKTQIL